MANKYSILKYLQSVDDYVDKPTLIALGADDSMLNDLVVEERMQVANIVDSTIADGVRCQAFDASNYLIVKDAEWLKPSVEVSMRALVALDNYVPSENLTFMSKVNGYTFRINSAGKWQVVIQSGVDNVYTSTNITGLTSGGLYWVRADWKTENGNGLSSVDFMYSNENVFDSNDVGSWTFVESVTKTKHSITHSTNPLYVGGFNTTGEAIKGKLFVVEVWGEGQRRMFFDLSYNAIIKLGLDTFFDIYGNTMTLVGSTNYLLQNVNGVVSYKYLTSF
jgi:hypothetical protein